MNTLLQDIEQEIQKSGGKLNLCRLLMDESPSWFSVKERRETRKQAYRETVQSNYIPAKHYFWTAEEKACLMENWPDGNRIKLAHKLRRKYHACEAKYYILKRNQWKQAS